MPGRRQIKLGKKRIRAILPPSPLLEVAGMTNPEHHEVRIWDELAQGSIQDETGGTQKPNEILAWADLVGISGLTTSRLGAYRVAEAARKLGKPVVAGGMDVTGHYLEGNGDELLTHYDSIVVGRLTKRLWAEVLADFKNHRAEPVYQAESLEDEPWEWVVPRHDLVVPGDYHFPAAVRSSAGCPCGCKFCTVGLICDRVEVKPYDILEAELALLFRTRMPLVDFSDSFGANYEHTHEVALPLLHASGQGWFTEMTTLNLMGFGSGRRSLIGPMAAAGGIGIYLGVEGIESATIDAIAKAPDLDVTEEAIREIHKAGLIATGSLMLDYTGEETHESTDRMVNWVIRNQLDLVQLSLVAALPGSKLRQEALLPDALRPLITQNPELFDGAWPTIKHPILSPQERIEMLRDAYYRIYSLGGIGRRITGHGHFRVNLIANLVVNRLSRRWWGKLGYDHWFANCGVAG
jgi:hypothetical protein